MTFPEDYPAENLAGKEVTFDIVAHEIKAPAESKIDDDFAKELGLESLEQLRTCSRASWSRKPPVLPAPR